MAKSNDQDLDAIYSAGAADLSRVLPAAAPAPTPAASAAALAAGGIAEAPAERLPKAVKGVPTEADVRRRAKELDVDPELAVSFWSQESGRNAKVRDSDKGAIGGFQVMPDTYKGVMGSYGGQRDAWNNMEAGLRYIAYGQKTLNTRDPELLAAGYHAGYDRKDLKAGQIPDVSDGHKRTPDYAREVATRVGVANGRYTKLTPEEAAKLESGGAEASDDTEGGRYTRLTPEEAAAMEAQANKPGTITKGGKLGVLTDNALPAPANQSLAPVTPQFRAEVMRAYDAADPATRARMAQTEGVVGQLVRERAGIPGASTDTGKLFDTTAEGRTSRLIKSGTDAKVAQTWGRGGAARGDVPGTELGTIGKSDFDFEAQKRFNKDPVFSHPAIRAAVKGYEGYKQGALGLVQAGAELMGANEAADIAAGGIKRSQGTEAAMGEASSMAQRNMEGAIASITQQLPALLGGAVSGTAAVPLAAMFTQTFGQEYGTGRARGQDPNQAATRAGLFATFEVLGEAFGVRHTVAGLRKTMALEAPDQIATAMGRALAADLPGEMGTTTGQFVTDKLGAGVGLNPEAGWKQYIEQMADTVVQTMMQGGLMMGATTGVSAAGRHLRGQLSRQTQELGAEQAREAALNKAATFFDAPNRNAPPAAPAPTGPVGRAVAKAAPVATPAPAAAPAAAPTTTEVVSDDGQTYTINVGAEGVSVVPSSTAADTTQAVDSPAEVPAEAGTPAAEPAESSTPAQQPSPIEATGTPPSMRGDSQDERYDEAVRIVQLNQRPSISLVQRHLRIGYNRAARLLEQMEANGIVSPMSADGNRTLLDKGDGSQPDAAPAPAAEAPPQADLSAMSEAELRERLKYVAQQAKLNGGHNKQSAAERRRVEAEIEKRKAAPVATPQAEPAEAAAEPAPPTTATGAYLSQSDANDAVRAAARQTGTPHAVVEREEDGQTVYAVQPIEEESDGAATDGRADRGADRGSADRPAATGTPAAAGQPGDPGDAAPAAADVAAGADGAGAGRDTALSAPDAHAGKWFGSREKADAYVAKKQAGATHEVVQTGKARFEVKPKAAPAVNPSIPRSDSPAVNDFIDGKRDTAPSLEEVAAEDSPAARWTRMTEMERKQVLARAGLSDRLASRAFADIEAPGQKRIAKHLDIAVKNKAAVEEAADPAQDLIDSVQAQPREPIDQEDADNDRPYAEVMAERKAAAKGGAYEGQTIDNPDDAELNAGAKAVLALPFYRIKGMIRWVAFKPRQLRGESEDSADAVQAQRFEDGKADRWNNVGHIHRFVSRDGQLWHVAPNWDGQFKLELVIPLEAAPVREETQAVQEAPAEAAPAPAPTASANTLFTEDAANAARARLRKKLGTLNSGIDPETMMDGITLAGYHIERGARSFAAYAQAMLDDLGDAVKPYLKSWYLGVRFDPRAASLDGMSATAEVEAANVDEIVKSSETPTIESQEIQGEDDAGSTVRGAGAESLEEVAAEGVPADAEGRDAEPTGAGREQGSRGAGGEPDGSGVSEARGGGSGAAGADPAAAGKRRRVSRSGGGGGGGRSRSKKASKPAPAAEGELFGDDAATPNEAIEAASPNNVPALDFVITDDVRLGQGSEAVKFTDNLTAIRTLKALEAENRRASPEEQKALARYVGWGGLKNAFRVAGAQAGEGVAKGWEARVAELEELLTPAELKAARNSTTAAHYTSQPVVQAIWKAAQRLGFAGGAVLEPSVGTGNFLGLMPEALRGKSNVFAVEYDSLTARIAQKLYPNADILHTGFQNVPLPRNQFALAIGNPPFGRESLYFRHNPGVNGKSIHNQFFLASLDAVADDGLMAMVVSHNLMDALNSDARQAMAERAHFVGAIRLPDTAFKENARTEVVTDILFFRKRSKADAETARMALDADRTGKLPAWENDAQRDTFNAIADNMRSWTRSQTIQDPSGSGEDINVNPYFLRHPDMVVGKIDATGKMNARADLNVRLDDPSQFQPLLDKAIARLPQSAPRTDVAASSLQHFKQMVTAMRLAVQRAEPGQVTRNADGQLKLVVDIDAGERGKSMLSEITLTPNVPIHPDYTLTLDGQWQRTVDKLGTDGKPLKVVKADGKVTNRNVKETVVFERLADIPEKDRWGAERVALVSDMLPLRDHLKRQLMLEAQDATERMMAENRAKLNAAYDAFVAKHGQLHAKSTTKLALMMPDGGLILATETVDKENRVTKSAIMSRRVTMPPQPAESAANARDAVAITLAEGGRIDLERVAKLLGTDPAGAEKALSEGDKPAAFFDPEEQRWEPADLYLSGLVRRKLLAAEAGGLTQNAAALREVIPKDWDSSQITPNIGSAWIPGAVYGDFFKHLGYKSAKVSYSPLTNSFSVSYDGKPAAQWATTGNAHGTGDIVSRLLNSQSMKVTFKDNDGKTHVDEEATTATQQKANELFNEFLDWAYQGDERRTELVRIFNEKYNTRVVRQRDGSHLTLPGKVPDTIIKMRRHQNNAIWRGITDRAVLYDHVVGAGKTFTAIARAMERRRMGLSRKPMIVVPNHLVEQWAHDAKLLYPGANLLAAGKEDFERANRRRLFARIAAGDYDMVIVGHSSFGFIELDPATEERYLDEELQSAYAAIKEAEEEAAANGQGDGWSKPFGVKEAERLVKKLEERLARLRDGTRDRLLTFEEMGVDDLTIDEAHEFKNLAYSSRLTSVSGMGNKTGSQKAMDLHMKVRSLNDRPGTSVAFLTGTPISNSVAEMYLVLRNLVPKEMKEMGIDNFDAWRSMYVSYASAYEPTEAGGVKEVLRLGREWMNMKSLMDLYYSVSDAVTIEDIKTAYAEDNPGKKFPVPDVRSAINGDGDREMVAVKPGPEQREILKDIVAGFNGLDGITDSQERNKARLRLMDRARKVSLDARAVDPHIKVAGDGGKIGAVVERAAKIYEKWSDDKGTQIIFLDRSVPKSKGDDKIVEAYDAARAKLDKAIAEQDEKAEQAALDALEKFNPNEIEALRVALQGGWTAYDEIKRQLVAKGIPEHEIRFVQEAGNDKQKAALFAQVKSGEVRILIGSTPRMGAGTNVQDRLVALHHVDVTWKPSDIEQREGRIVRQGNQFVEETLPDGTPNPNYKPGFAVDVIAYATEMTVDAKMWALNATKLKAINGIRKYDGSFQMEFEDEESAGMAEMAALATGNPLMVERVTLNGDINKLEMQQRSYKNRTNALRDNLSRAKRDVETAPGKIERATAFAAELEQQKPAILKRSDARGITIEGKHYTNKLLAEADARHKIAVIRGGEEKARWSLDVNGTKVTNLDNLDAALMQAFGTPEFEATVDGKTYIGLSDAARAIHAMMTGQTEKTFTLGGFTVNGIPVELDVETYSWNEKERYLRLHALNAAGQSMTGYSHSLGTGEISAAQIRTALDGLKDRLNPARFHAEAKEAERDAANATKDIPGLEAEVAKPWPKEEELTTKRERLQQVITTLAASSDASRLEDTGANDDSQQASASVAAQPTQGTAARLLRDTLTGSDVGGLVQVLLDAGRIVIHDTAATIPAKTTRGVQAVTMPDGTIHMVAGNLDAQRALPVLLHEMFHSGVRPLLGEAAWADLMVRLGALMRQGERSNGRARAFFDAAFDRQRSAARAGDPRAMHAEEFGAYAIEEYEKAPMAVKGWVDDLLGRVKAWLLRTFGLQAGKVTPAQLRALALAALRDAGTSPGTPTMPDIDEDDIELVHRQSVAGAGAGLTPPEPSRFRRLQAAVQDNMNRVNAVQERIKALSGVKELALADYYRAETNRPGRVAARLEDAERQLIKPLMTRLAKAGFTPAQLAELLHAQHAEERNKRVAAINADMPDGGSGMTTAEARRILASVPLASELREIAQQARDIARATLDLKRAYGLIEQDAYDALTKAYDYYVPLKGDGEYGPKIKRAMGHDEREEHILENIARDYDQAVVMGEKNLARQSLLALVAQHPDAALWTIGVPPKGRYVAGQVFNVVDPSRPKGDQTIGSFISRAQLDAFLEGAGSKAAGYIVLDSNGARVAEFTKPLQDNEVMVYVDGQPVRIQIHDETLARQVRPLDTRQLPWLLEKMRGLNRYFSKIYTGYNPTFILRNVSRDAMTGSINMLGNEGATVAARAWTRYPGTLKALAQWAATGKTPAGATGKYLQEYRNHGGKTGASWMSDLEEHGKTLTRLYEDAYGAGQFLATGHGVKAAKVAGRKIVGGMAHAVEVLNQAAENALRLALYITLRERGETASIAAAAAKRVTVDFDRKGTATGAMGAVYLFINPAIQGTANLLHTLLKGKHRGQAWAAVGMLASLGVYAALTGMDDDRDRWLGVGWEQRSKNFRLHLGSHTLTVPLSQEYAPAYAMGVALGEALRGESAMTSAVRTVSSFIDAYFPLRGAFNPDSNNHLQDAGMAVVPTAFKPAFDIGFNRNVFGSQIVPESSFNQHKPDNLKMFRATKGSLYDTVAQQIAAAGEKAGAGRFENDLSKVSPETLKYLWRTYTGGLGQFVTDSIGAASLATEPGAMNSGDLPIVKDFVKPDDVKPLRGRYFDLSRDAQQAAAEFAQAKKAGDGAAMDAFLARPGQAELLSLARMFERTGKAAAAIRDEADTLNADKSLTTAQKREQLKALEAQEESLYRLGINAFMDTTKK